MEYDLPLDDLNNRRIGPYGLKADLRPVEGRVGWTHFSLFLEEICGGDRQRKMGSAPVIEGIHSRGGKGIKSWIEVESYAPLMRFDDDAPRPRMADLSGTGTERELMRILACKVAPGGHMMFAYDTALETAFYRETLECLCGNIPPVCTPLGKLLFDAGFRLVKDWYLAEGGFEGPRKLWGEMPLDAAASRLFDGMTFFRVLAFCSAEPRGDLIERELAARNRAALIMGVLRLSPPLSELAESVALYYRDCGDAESLVSAARRTCRSVFSVLTSGQGNTADLGELERIVGECSKGN